ncbi:four helix bundle protein [Ectothiorhodospiraceae bacterium BW-2]|nr:four helix bundle protein [Ectothiorhodospiraceae bacterium BW-2]
MPTIVTMPGLSISTMATPTTTTVPTLTVCGWFVADSDFDFFIFIFIMSHNLPIWRDTQRLLVRIEEVVRHFPRYHKYALGSDMRRQAMRLMQLLMRALQAQNSERIEQVKELQLAIGEMKVMIQTAKELQAFQHFAQFEELSLLAVTIGRQSGGWLNKLSSRAQPEQGGG